jgi:TolA-binding protein
VWARRFLTTIFVLGVGAGCANDKNAKTELNEGYASLEARQYDQAIDRADAFLQHTPAGAGTAEALYLKGQALEQKQSRSVNESRANWQAAREAYVQALSQKPSAKLEPLLHAGIANVAFFQDDYQTAITEWTAAHDKLQDDSTRSWVLYRVGLSRQRMGQFAEADPVFAAVQERYPNTPAAQQAQKHQGVRGFSVQFATFGNAANADAAMAALRKEGVVATKQTDARGRSIILHGPLPSYQQAQAVKARYASQFPDAIIVP